MPRLAHVVAAAVSVLDAAHPEAECTPKLIVRDQNECVGGYYEHYYELFPRFYRDKEFFMNSFSLMNAHCDNAFVIELIAPESMLTR